MVHVDPQNAQEHVGGGVGGGPPVALWESLSLPLPPPHPPFLILSVSPIFSFPPHLLICYKSLAYSLYHFEDVVPAPGF